MAAAPPGWTPVMCQSCGSAVAIERFQNLDTGETAMFCGSAECQRIGPRSTQRPSAASCRALKTESRRIFAEHGKLTLDYIHAQLDSPVDSSPAIDAAATPLMRNQEEIGAFLNQLIPGVQEVATRLFKEHIGGAVKILLGAKHGTSKLQMRELEMQWHRNGRQISAAIAPGLGLSKEDFNDHMFMHLVTTLDEALLHRPGQPPTGEELAQYAIVQNHLKMMADLIVSGVCQ